MTPFFWKRCFLTWLKKVGFTNCVLEKLCFPENTIFIVFSANTAFQKQKLYVEKTENLWKTVGCFWTWQNGVFWVCFLGFNIKRFVFGVSGIVSIVLKMLVFPVLGAFLGWLFVVHLGLEGLGAFVFLVFVFLFCVAFVSVLFALLLVLWLDVVVLFFCVFFGFLFCFGRV